MFFRRVPSDDEIGRILARVSDRAFNYDPVGATDEPIVAAPPGFKLSAYGTNLGVGDAVFGVACEALSRFQNYPPSFSRAVCPASSIEVGTVFGTVARHFGFASLHPCRIVKVVRDDEPRRFGFSLGTLPGHIGAGEERFLVTLDEATGLVRYDVQAISKPAGLLGRLGSPVFRSFQRRFERETQSTMQGLCAAVAAG